MSEEKLQEIIVEESEQVPEQLAEEPEQLSEEEIKAIAAQAEFEKKAAEVREANIALLIDAYLKDKADLRDEDDSLNISENSIVRWDFKNIPCPSIEELHALIEPVKSKVEQEKINAEALAFLEATDFKVLRHIRQKTLGQHLSLSEEEYLALEQQRSDAAASIVR